MITPIETIRDNYSSNNLYEFSDAQLLAHSNIPQADVPTFNRNFKNITAFTGGINRLFLDGRDVNIETLTVSQREPVPILGKIIVVIFAILIAPISLAWVICYLIRMEMVRVLDERDVIVKIAAAGPPQGPGAAGSAQSSSSEEASDVESDVEGEDKDKELLEFVKSRMGSGSCGALNLGLLNIFSNKDEKNKSVDETDEAGKLDEDSGTDDEVDEPDTKVTKQPQTLYEEMLELQLQNVPEAKRKAKLEESNEIDEETELQLAYQRLNSVPLETFMEGLGSIFKQIDHAKALVNVYDDSEVDREHHYQLNYWGERALNETSYANAIRANTLRKTREKNVICRAFEQTELSFNVLIQALENLELSDSSEAIFYKENDVQAHILNVFMAMSGMIKFMHSQEASPKFSYCKTSLQLEVEELHKLLGEWKELKGNEKTSEDTIEEIDQCLELVDQVLLVQSQFLEFEDNLGFNILRERAAIVDVDLDDRELVLLCSELFPSIYTDFSLPRTFSGYYNQDGYKADGYNREGFNRWGTDRDGYNRDGYRYGYDREGFNQLGYDGNGFDRDGYNRQGRDRDGFNRAGYDIRGVDVDNQTVYDENGFNPAGYDDAGFNQNGRDFTGYDRDGYNQFNRHRNGHYRYAQTYPGYRPGSYS